MFFIAICIITCHKCKQGRLRDYNNQFDLT